MAYKELTQRSGMAWSHVLQETSSDEFITLTAKSTRRNISQPHKNPNQNRSIKTISLPELTKEVAADRPIYSTTDATLQPIAADSNTNNTPTNVDPITNHNSKSNSKANINIKSNRNSKPTTTMTQATTSSRDGVYAGGDQWVRSEKKSTSLSEGRAVDVSYRNTYGDNVHGPAAVHLTTDYRREFSLESSNRRRRLQQERRGRPIYPAEEERSRAAASRQLERIYGLLHHRLQREDYVVVRKSRRRNRHHCSGNYLPAVLPKFNLEAAQSISQVMHEETQSPVIKNSSLAENTNSKDEKSSNQRQITERVRYPPVTTASTKPNSIPASATKNQELTTPQRSYKSVESFNKIILITKGHSIPVDGTGSLHRQHSLESRAEDKIKPTTAATTSKPPTATKGITYPKIPASVKRKHVLGLRSMTYVPPNSASSTAALAPTVLIAATSQPQSQSQSVADMY